METQEARRVEQLRAQVRDFIEWLQAQGRIIEERGLADAPECTECAVKKRCNHTCGCLNRQATGSIDRVSPVQCTHERMLLTIADKIAEKLYKERNPLFLHKHYNKLYPVLSLIEDRSSIG